MTQATVYTCDAQSCGKDITTGDGRAWRISVQSVVTAIKPNTMGTRVDQNLHTPMMHFCDHTCLAVWANAEAAIRSAAQTKFAEAKAAEAAAVPKPAA